MPAARRTLLGSRPGLVLLVQAIFVVEIYRSSLGLWILSDAWVLIEQARHGFWHAVSTTIGWHYIPVATAVNALAVSALGTDAAGYQAMTIGLHILVGFQVYLLGKRILLEVPAALTGSLLFLGSASFYEVSFWPLVGHAYVLAAVLFLLGLDTALEIVTPQPRRGARWRLALWFLLAVFCYPGMVTLLPMAGVVLILGRFGGLGALPPHPWRESAEWKWLAGSLLPCVAALLLPLMARAHFTQEVSAATFLRFDWVRAYGFVRAMLSVFSLRGATEVVHGLLTLGTQVRSGVWLQLLIWSWLAILVLLTASSFWRSRSPAHALLLSWVIVQIGLTSLSLVPSSRHLYLASAPAALLAASSLRAAGVRLARRLRGPGGYDPLPLAVMTLGGLALLGGARSDLRAALEAGHRASDVTRQAVMILQAALRGHDDSLTVTLVDMPSVIRRGSIGAYAFTNGVAEMVRLASGRSQLAVELLCTTERRVNFAMGSRPVSPRELRALSSDPHRLVLLFDEKTGSLLPLTGGGDGAGAGMAP